MLSPPVYAKSYFIAVGAPRDGLIIKCRIASHCITKGIAARRWEKVVEPETAMLALSLGKAENTTFKRSGSASRAALNLVLLRVRVPSLCLNAQIGQINRCSHIPLFHGW